VPSIILTYFNVSAVPILPIPLPVYMICTYVGVNVAFNAISLTYGTKLPVFHSEEGDPLSSFPRFSGLLNHRLSCDAVQCKQGPDTQSAQDYSLRHDVLFPGHIHCAVRVRDVCNVRKCRDIVITLFILSTTRSDLYSPDSNYSLAGG